MARNHLSLSYLLQCGLFSFDKGALQLVFRSFSKGIDPCVAVDSAYPWEESVQYLPVSPSWTSPSVVHFKSALKFLQSFSAHNVFKNFIGM